MTTTQQGPIDRPAAKKELRKAIWNLVSVVVFFVGLLYFIHLAMTPTQPTTHYVCRTNTTDTAWSTQCDNEPIEGN